MAEGWKVMEPVLRSELITGLSLQEAAEQALSEDGDLYGMRFVGDILEFAEGKTLDVSGCIFERCTFSELDIGRLSFSDCVFEKCELSNARLMGAAFQRVRFSNCRMTGMELMRAAVMSVTFDSCMMDYLSLSECKIDRVLFTDCRMRESLWAEVKLPKVRFERADLTRAQWIRTPLMGIDMSTSVIAGWNITLFDLKGVKVTAAQVIELSGLLGVEIIF